MGIDLKDKQDAYHIDIKNRAYRYNELDELDAEYKQEIDFDIRDDEEEYSWEHPFAVYDPDYD